MCNWLNPKTYLWIILLIFFVCCQTQAILPCDCQENRVLMLRTPAIEGDDVILLQERLKELEYYQGIEDGVYDLEVARAVTSFQAGTQIEPSGVVDAETWEILGDGVFPVGSTQSKEAPQGEINIVINIFKRNLIIFENGQKFKTYPVAVGKASTKTPVGEWAIISKSKDWGGGFGTRWLGLNVPWGIYGIHGTNKPWSIGRAASHGCIRMLNRHVEELFKWIPLKTRVTIIGKRLPINVNQELRPGQMGLSVMQLQDNLKKNGFKPGFCDARYGPTTELAIKELETQYRLKTDGSADWNVIYLLDLPAS